MNSENKQQDRVSDFDLRQAEAKGMVHGMLIGGIITTLIWTILTLLLMKL
jgi:hypothetical protein